MPLQQVWVAPQERKHPLQWSSSLAGSTQLPPQHSRPLPHAVPQSPQNRASLLRSTQRPPQQVSPSPHCTPQKPQFDSSVNRSKPSSVRPLQLSSMLLQRSATGEGSTQ